MALAIDGLVSGLDTTALINSLMQVEAIPQVLLKNKVSGYQTMVSALQGLNTRVAELAELATKTAKPAALDLHTAASSSDKVTATATAGAAAGQLDLVVNQLAQAQITVSAPMTAWPDDPPELTIAGADGVPTQVTAASGSLDDVVTAINAAGVGVSAVKVSSGKDANGDTQYRLQLTGTATGEAGAFTISGTSVELTQIRAAQNAEVALWSGTPAEQIISSATNTFAGLLPGVEVTVAAASADPVTITIARDDAQIGTIAEGMVKALNGIFAEIASKTAIGSTTNSSGATKVTSGVFTGDSTVRDVNQKLLSAASMPVDGRSPSEFGISITKSGNLEFDADKFTAALAQDPVRAQAALQEIASRVAVAAGDASDKYGGQITSRITGQESLVKDLNTRIEDWDRRLSSRRVTLERTYAALEVQLSALNSQSAWLSSQLAGLPNGGGNQ